MHPASRRASAGQTAGPAPQEKSASVRNWPFGYPEIVINPLIVRQATAADARLVARLQEDMDREFGAPDKPGFVDRFAEVWLNNADHRPTWIAERGGDAIGVLVLVVVDKLPRAGRDSGRWAHVSLVFVAKNARNAGIGTLLLQRMLAWASDNDVDRIQLNANAKSAPLYQKVGFGPAPARLMERRT